MKTNKPLELSIIEEVQSIKPQSIKTQEDLTKATEILSKLNQRLDTITEEKEKITKPLNEALKVERARWKPAEEALTKVILGIRTALSQYQSAQIALNQAKQLKLATKLAEGKITLNSASKQLETLPDTNQRISSDTGSIKFTPKKQIDTIDLAKLPLEYHLADEVAIRKAMNAGTELAGVTYKIVQIPVNQR
jgi:chromosome segregation ATPase